MAEDAGVIAALCPQTEQTDTESEGEAAGPADVAMLSEDEGADSDDAETGPEYRSCEPVGPWLVNTKSGWSHRAVSGSDAGVVVDGLCWGLACRPAAALGSWFEFRLTDPELEGFHPCGHGGCLVGNT